MKPISFLLSLAELGLLAHKATAYTTSGYPKLAWDLDTVADCLQWYNNAYGETCQSVLDKWGISIEDFTLWNPSVDANCEPWEYQSYCLISETRYNETVPETTTSEEPTTTATPTSTAPTLGPSPTSWIEMGCYVEDPELPLLDINYNPNGDASLTIPKCKQTCYRRFYEFAGVQNGNECWCGTYVGGVWAANQTDCNSPCTGNPDTFCGGPGLLNIFRAEENVPPVTTTASATITASASETSLASTVTESGSISGIIRSSISGSISGSVVPTSSVAPVVRRDSGAIENLAMF